MKDLDGKDSKFGANQEVYREDTHGYLSPCIEVGVVSIVFVLLCPLSLAYQNPPLVTSIPHNATMSVHMLCATHSMGNLLSCNDKVYGEWITPGITLKEGDIVMIKHPDYVIVHRIIQIVSSNGVDYYITKGDNNTVDDANWLGLLKRSDLKSKVIGIQKAYK